MEDILKLIEGYGLPLVLLLGALYALYRFLVFKKKNYLKYDLKNFKCLKEVNLISKP